MLSDEQRAHILDGLRDRAIRKTRELGCDCQATWELSERVFGPQELPVWISDHSDACNLNETLKTMRARAAIRAAAPWN